MVMLQEISEMAADQNLERGLLELLNQFEEDNPVAEEENLKENSSSSMDASNILDVKEYNASNHNVLSSGDNPKVRPDLSYVALIGLAILSSPDKKMRLSDIYKWICRKFPFYKSTDQSWRNSIRHNLSLNECFMKTDTNDCRRKGHFWTVHPANLADFMKGDFRRRIARLKVRKTVQRNKHFTGNNQQARAIVHTGFVPMTSWNAPLSRLVTLFGLEAVTSKAERLALDLNSLSNGNDNASEKHQIESPTTLSNYHFLSNDCSGYEMGYEYFRSRNGRNRPLHNLYSKPEERNMYY